MNVKQEDKTFRRSTWADAEMDFAQLNFSSFDGSGNAVRTARICVDDFLKELKSYLMREECRFLDHARKFEEVNIRQKCFKRLCVHCLGLLEEWNCFDIEVSHHLLLDFVTLNYTHTIDWLLSDMAPVSMKGGRCVFIPERVVHAHGELGKNADFELFGVDRSDQIADVELRRFAEKTGYLLKPKLDELTGNNRIPLSYALMKKASWVWLFGVSLGHSDFSWWQKCLRLLLNNGKCSKIFYFDRLDCVDDILQGQEQRDMTFLFEDFFEPHLSLDTPIYDSDKFSDVEDRIITDSGRDPLGLEEIQMNA